MLLHVALQDGFRGDSVRIEVNGREIFRKEGVTTVTQISFADSVEIDLPSSPPVVRVQVLSLSVSEFINVPPQDPTYLGISITSDGKIRHKISREPFGYL